MSSEEDAEFGKAADEIQAAIEKEAEILYSKKVIIEANNPQNVGRMAEPDGAGEITGPCGDTMEFYLKVKDGIIEQISFYTDGCGTTIACGSMTTRLVMGMGVKEARKLTNQDIINALDGLPEENLHCAKLAADTLQAAINNYLDRKEE
ncbi:MAG: iron-sulfur cluster assembly scaffold protein [Thermoplasmata archaeon]|nr:iron-sulfur cluster assembly scaffold protein [Thermoplasmata archaeon]